MNTPTRLAFLGELRRYPHEGWIAGICAGIADYFGWKVKLVRLALVLMAFFTFGWFFIITYAVMWFAVDEAPPSNAHRARYASPPTANPAPAPAADVNDIKQRFTRLDTRLRHMEEAALNKDAALARELDQLAKQ